MKQKKGPKVNPLVLPCQSRDSNCLQLTSLATSQNFTEIVSAFQEKYLLHIKLFICNLHNCKRIIVIFQEKKDHKGIITISLSYMYYPKRAMTYCFSSFHKKFAFGDVVMNTQWFNQFCMRKVHK